MNPSTSEGRREREVHVGRIRPIEVPSGPGLLVDDDPPDLGPCQYVPTVASDKKILARLPERIVRLEIHDRDVVRAHFARKAAATKNGNVRAARVEADPPAEEEVCDAPDAIGRPDGELTRVLEGEVPFFRKKRGGSVSDSHPRCPPRLGAKSVLMVTSRFRLAVRPYLTSSPMSPFVELSAFPASKVLRPPPVTNGLDAKVESAVERTQVPQAPRQADSGQAEGARDRCPEHLLVLAANVAHEVDPPRLGICVREPECDHRDLDLRYPVARRPESWRRTRRRPSPG